MNGTDQSAHGDASQSPQGTPQEHLHTLAEDAGALLDDAREHGARQYEQYRDLAAEQLDSLVEGAQSAASALEGKDSLGLAQYMAQLASGLGDFADQVRDNSIEDLVHKGAQLARDNPTLFLAGSVAIGFGLSRFLRASSSHPTASGTPTQAYGASTPYQSSVPPLRDNPVPADPLGRTLADGPNTQDSFKGGA